MTKSIISEVITKIRNAVRVKKFGVIIPNTRITTSLVKILLREGFITEWITVPIQTKRKSRNCLFLQLKYSGSTYKSVLVDIQLISRPGLRIYTSHKRIPQVIGGIGLVILSTPKGLITNQEARHWKVGGEMLCSVWLDIYIIIFKLHYESSIFGKKNL